MGMKKFALSIINPISYLVCSGVKWVENRTWSTDYRGRVYIHSSTTRNFTFIDSSLYPDGLSDELKRIQAELKGKVADIPYIKKYVKKHGEEKWFDAASFGEGLEKLHRFYKKSYGDGWEELAHDLKLQKDFFKSHEKKLKCFAIIGHVDLINIIEGCKSAWAEPGVFHWIFDNPVLYDKPVINVKGKLRLFDVSHIDFPDD